MEKILEFFVSFGEAISAFFRFFLSIIEDLVYLVKLLVTFVKNIPGYFSWIPTEAIIILTLLTSLVGLYVIVRIAGKE